MKTTLEMVADFHDTFNVPVVPTPTVPSFERGELRLALLREELKELEDAISDENLVDIFDALLDLQYVLDGTFLECGLHNLKMRGMREVQRSNMSKLDDNGKPILRGDGKILKGPRYTPPNLQSIVNGETMRFCNDCSNSLSCAQNERCAMSGKEL